MKKGQIRMTETIAVLFIFFVLILFGLIFYFRYSESAFKAEQEEMFGKKAIDLTTKTIFLPELLCSKGEAEAEDFCFDMMKLRHTEKTLKKHLSDYYFGLFSYAKISVQEIYPDDDSWIIYEKKKPNSTRVDPTFFVVSLKDESLGGQPSYGFGVVKVEVYS